MRIYPKLFKVCFSWMDAELAHTIGFLALKFGAKTGALRGLAPFTRPDAGLRTSVCGLNFPSPFGLAAGFDEDGTGIEALAELGFGHIEVGTLTAQAQPGNPKPRLFRLPQDKALINRMGFNNNGAEAAAAHIARAKARLEKRHGTSRPIIGINIGKTKSVELDGAVGDYLKSTEILAPVADYLVVNVSSPNTPGLRLLQEVSVLEELLRRVRDTAVEVSGRHVPLFVKIAPDLANDDLDDIARLVLKLRLDGIIATNTTLSRDGLKTPRADVEKLGAGGLSGAPLKSRAVEVLRRLDDALGAQAVIISSGGVTDGDDVAERLESGASLVQGYTAFLYEGPLWARRINKVLSVRRIDRRARQGGRSA